MKKYRQVDLEAYTGHINLSSDPLWLVMLSPSYTPNLDTHVRYTDLTNELPTGAGYTQGGIQMSGVSIQYTTATNWSAAWSASTAHVAEDCIRPATANGYLYRCTSSGTTGATAPTWPTSVGATVADGSCTWECVGSGVTSLTASNVTWPAPFTAGPLGFIAMVDKIVNPGYLIGLSTINPALTGQGGSFAEQWNPLGIFYMYEQ